MLKLFVESVRHRDLRDGVNLEAEWEVDMLWALIAILLVLWLLGLIGHIGGALIHLLLVVAVIAVIFNLMSGRRTVS